MEEEWNPVWSNLQPFFFSVNPGNTLTHGIPPRAMRTAGGPYLRQWMPPFEQNNINWLGNLNALPCSGSQLLVSHNGVATLIPEQPTCWTQRSEAIFCGSSSEFPSQWSFDENLCSRLPFGNGAVCTFMTAVPGQWVSPHRTEEKSQINWNYCVKLVRMSAVKCVITWRRTYFT